MTRCAFLLLAGAATLGACSAEQPEPVPEMIAPATADPSVLPALLRDKSTAGMEAMMAGRLTRRGPCLYLDGGSRAVLILWGDDVRIARLDGEDWVVSNASTNQRFVEGDWLEGAGGYYPADRDVRRLTEDSVPQDCRFVQSGQLHGARKASPPDAGDGPPPPPPPPPPAPRIIDQVEQMTGGDNGFPSVRIRNVADPREALFIHALETYTDPSQYGGRHVCLSDTDAALLERLSKRFKRLHPGEACGWNDGGVVLGENGESALFVHAKVDCSGTQCAAEAGATYGNMGAEGWGYRMRRKGNDWTIQKTGISWIS